MLAERLSKAWRARQASTVIEPMMRFAPDGLLLGAQTVLAPADNDIIRLEGREARFSALMAAAHLRVADAHALNHIQKAAQRWSEGQVGLAKVHLALSRLNRLDDPQADSQRLFLADSLMAEGIEPEAVLRALSLEPRGPEPLDKDYRTQPRVPKGSGRTSGEWTSDGGDDAGSTGDAGNENPWSGVGAAAAANLRGNLVAARYDARAPAAKPGLVSPDLLETAPKFVAPAAGRAWFMGLTSEQLLALGAFALRFGGPAAAFSTLFIPFNKSLRQDGTIPGWPPIHFLSDERSLTLSYLGPDGRPTTKVALLDKHGIFRDADGKPIGIMLPDSTIVIDRTALFPQQARGKDEPTLCPKPEPDIKHGTRGVPFEDFMKRLINPENPTPSMYGVRFTNPWTGARAIFDDCQRRTGVYFDYKGVTYAKLLGMSYDGPKEGTMNDLIKRAQTQLAAAKGEPIVWVFAEKAAADLVEEKFRELGYSKWIQIETRPWSGPSKI